MSKLIVVAFLLCLLPTKAYANPYVVVPNDFPNYAQLVSFTSRFADSIVNRSEEVVAASLLDHRGQRFLALDKELLQYFFLGTTRPPNKDVWDGLPLQRFFRQESIESIILSSPIQKSPYRNTPYFYEPRSFLVCWYNSQSVELSKLSVEGTFDDHFLRRYEQSNPLSLWCVFVTREKLSRNSVLYKEPYIDISDIVEKYYPVEGD